MYNYMYTYYYVHVDITYIKQDITILKLYVTDIRNKYNIYIE